MRISVTATMPIISKLNAATEVVIGLITFLFKLLGGFKLRLTHPARLHPHLPSPIKGEEPIVLNSFYKVIAT
jgi:hypothetical protein